MSPSQFVRRIVRRIPQRASGVTGDVVLALALFVLSLAEPMLVMPATPERYIALAAAPFMTLPLVWRRRFPVLVLSVILAASSVRTALGVSTEELAIGMVAVFFACYGAGAYTAPRGAAVGITLALLLVTISILTDPADFGAIDLLFAVTIVSGVWGVGRLVHSRSAAALRHEQRARELESDADERARQAVEAERRRIARELHDVIAHSLSLMVLQAGAAERMVMTSPDRAIEPIRVIQETGRLALADMKQLLGILRDRKARAELQPQPGLKDLEPLLARVRESGLAVELVTFGPPYAPPDGVVLSVYRIVQEALTNTMKHADADRARVVLRYAPRHVEVEVIDDGRGVRGGNGTGTGLIGMRERVDVLGGDFTAGRRPEGGFAVRACLPVEPITSGRT